VKNSSPKPESKMINWQKLPRREKERNLLKKEDLNHLSVLRGLLRVSQLSKTIFKP
jgi:hypothetical protein